MDFIFKLGEVFLVLACVSVMLFYLAGALEDIDDTKEYITDQNAQDEQAGAYARVAAVDFKAVSCITKQEALDFIFTHTSDSSAVMLDTTPIARQQGEAPCTFPLPDNSSNQLYRWYLVTSEGSFNTNLPAGVGNPTIFSYGSEWLNSKSSKLPSYGELSSRLGGSNVMYYVDVDPLGYGDSKTVLVKRVN